MGTIRTKFPGFNKNKQYIFAHFHQDEIILINTSKNVGLCTMTSTSKDGEIMTKFLQLMGYICIRGSSNKNPVRALLEMINFCKKQKNSAVIAVDGPKGPIYKVKKGVITLAKKTGYPIIPAVAIAKNAFCLENSWNKALIPKPFSSVEVIFGEEIYIDSNEKDLDKQAIFLEQTLLALKTKSLKN